VHQHHDWETARALRDAQLAGERDLLALLVPRERNWLSLMVSDGKGWISRRTGRSLGAGDCALTGREIRAAATTPTIRWWIMVASCRVLAAMPRTVRSLLRSYGVDPGHPTAV
jgi:hypothetical protein